MNAVISARIIEQVNSGKSVKQAIDAVLGEGTFESVAGDLYETLTKAA